MENVRRQLRKTVQRRLQNASSSALIALSVAAVAVPALADPAFKFSLRDVTTGEVLVSGIESTSRLGELEVRETTYAAAKDGALWLDETAEIRAGRLQRLVSADRRTGERVDVHIEANGIFRIETQSNAHAPVESSTFSSPPDTILGKAIPILLLERWQALLAGDVVKFRLLVPEHRDSYGYQARRIDAAAGGETHIIVEADTWMIRLFAPDLVFIFAASSDRHAPKLKELVAPSPVEIGGERYRQVRMVIE